MSKKIIDKLLKAAAHIHKATMRGAGSYIITSSDVSEMIQEVQEEHIKRENREENLKDLLDE